MRLKKSFLFSVVLVVIGGIFGFSIWYRWNNDPTIIRQQLPEIKPIAEFSHGTWIHAVAISPINSNRFVSVGQDNVIKVWNRKDTDTPVITLTDPDTINFVAFSPTGEWLMSKSYWSLIFWNISSGAKIGIFEIHSTAAAALPAKHLLATASKDVKLWDIRNPKEITGIIVLPPKMGGKPLLHEAASFSGGKPRSLQQHNEAVRHHNTTVNQLYRVIDFSDDGKWLAAGGGMYEADNEIWRDKVKIWDLQHRKLVKIFPRELPKGVEPKPNTNYSDIRSIRFSPNNRFFASVGSNGYTIWTLPEWHVYCSVHAQTGDEGFVQVDNKRIYTGGYIQNFKDLAFSPDSKMYAVADTRAVTLWSVESAMPIAILKADGLLSDAIVIAFSQDGHTLAGGCMDGVLRLWDLKALQEK